MSVPHRIFPPGLPLVWGSRVNDELAMWAARRIAHVGEGGFGPCWAIGVVRARELAAVVVLHDWQPDAGTVQLSAAAESPRWATKQVVGAILGAVFDGALGRPVRKIWTATPHENTRALRFNEGIGFKKEAVLAHHFAPKAHCVICRMFRPDWARRYEGG